MDEQNTQAQSILARLDQLPIWPYSRWLIFIVGVGFFFCYFDTTSIGVALPIICQQFGIASQKAVLFISASLIGYIVGAIIDGRISDLFGRRLALYLSVAFFSLGSFGSAFSQGFLSLIICRFVIGMGIGAEIANVSTYIGELAPRRCRGYVSALAVFYGFLGFAVTPFFGLWLVPHFSYGWRLLFLLGALGGVFTLWLRRKLPASIRWYVARGEYAAAENLLTALEKKVCEKLNVTQLPSVVENSADQMSYVASSPTSYIKTTIFFLALWFFYYVCSYGWLTLAPDLLVTHGFTIAKSLVVISLGSLGYIVGSMIAVKFADRFQRKYTSAMAALCLAIAIAVIGWFPHREIVIVCGFIAATCCALIVPLLYTYTAESFPTTTRSTNLAITDGFGHLGGAVCGPLVMMVYAWFNPVQYGFQAAFTFLALAGVVTFAIILCGKKMNDKTLAQ